MAQIPQNTLNTLPPSYSIPLISNYFQILPQYLDRAEDSIDICIYTARYYRGRSNNVVNDFFKALRRACARGVKVRMLLNSDFSSPQFRLSNEFIAKFFKQENFTVAFAGKSTRLHAKMVLIDDNISVVGSHNFSRRAARSNFETSILTISKPVNHQYRQQFERLWKSRQLIKGKIGDPVTC